MKAQHQVISGFWNLLHILFLCSVTCRLVPVRWVGVQLYPAAHWQQKQRLSLEDSHTERLGFSPLLTSLRDSGWGDLLFCYFLSSSYLFLSLQCFALPPWSSHGLHTHPAFSSVAAHLLSVAHPCQRWCFSATVHSSRAPSAVVMSQLPDVQQPHKTRPLTPPAH